MEVGVFTDVTGEQSCVSCWDLKTGVMLKSFKNGSCSAKGLAVSENRFVYAAQHDKQIIHVYGLKKVFKKQCYFAKTLKTIKNFFNYWMPPFVCF